MASGMSKKNWLIRITLITVVLALVGGALSCDSSLLSQKAPDFTLPTMTGDNITLSELEGTPVVINFWATSCTHCVAELPYFEAAAKSEVEVRVIATNVGQPLSEVERFFGGYEPTMIVTLDETTEIFQTYSRDDNSRGYIPITFFIDSEGIVQFIKIGAFQSETELWDSLNDVFGITTP